VAKKKRKRWDNLKRNRNLKHRRDYIETHYIDGMESITGKGEGIRPLTPEEKDWLDKFYGEFVNASVSHDDYDNQLHNDRDMVKDCYDRNNARNRCVLNKGKAINKIDFRTWGELDQDTISDSVDYKDEMSERLDDYESKYKMYKKVSKEYPDLFTFEEFMSYDINMIYDIISSKE
jgi:hypothetical protein